MASQLLNKFLSEDVPSSRKVTSVGGLLGALDGADEGGLPFVGIDLTANTTFASETPTLPYYGTAIPPDKLG